MRNGPTQYFAVILCLLLIGQQFCAGRVADEILRRYKSKREVEDQSLKEKEDIDEETKEVATIEREKRSVGTILFGAAFLVSIGGVGFQLYLAHNKGCCELYNSICSDEKRFKDKRDEAKAVSDVIDIVYLNAENLFEWTQSINYRIQELWLKIEDISSLNDQIVEGVNPAIINELEAISEDIEDEIVDKNETTLAYENADLNLRYTTVWDDTKTALQTGFYLASYPLSLLAQQLINFFINRSINKFAATLSLTYGSILQNSLAGNGKAASFFGVRNAADIDGNVVQTAKAIQAGKHAKTATWGPRIVEGLTIVTSLATIVLEAWSVYQTWEDCAKIADKVDDAADDMEEVYDDNVALNETVKEYYDNITYYYDDVRTQLLSEDLTLALEEIKNITLYAANTERMQTASDAIDEWFAGIGDADESTTYDLLGTLIDGLGNVSYTLECYRNKYRAIDYVSGACADGDDTMANIYTKAEADFFLNAAECIDDDGYQYTTYDNIVEIIEGLAETQGYNSDCILNSDTMLALVCNDYWNGVSDENIMADRSLTLEQVEYFKANCGPKPLDPITQSGICSLLDLNTTGLITVTYIATFYNLDEETVEEGIANCNEESTTESFTETTTVPTTTEPTTPEEITTEAATTTEEPITIEPTVEDTTTTTTTTTTPAPVVSSRRRRRRRRRIWRVGK